ncbi:MAG TPA: hypothetical protein VF544_18525 [Pyrinomonadaceae bacterium]|jgi:hypothetical protein
MVMIAVMYNACGLRVFIFSPPRLSIAASLTRIVVTSARAVLSKSCPNLLYLAVLVKRVKAGVCFSLPCRKLLSFAGL